MWTGRGIDRKGRMAANGDRVSSGTPSSAIGKMPVSEVTSADVGLFSSHLTAWRKARHEGSLRGPGAEAPLPQAGPGQSPSRTGWINSRPKWARLEKQLATAETIVEVQGKVAGLLDLSFGSAKSSVDGRCLARTGGGRRARHWVRRAQHLSASEAYPWAPAAQEAARPGSF